MKIRKFSEGTHIEDIAKTVSQEYWIACEESNKDISVVISENDLDTNILGLLMSNSVTMYLSPLLEEYAD